MPYEERNAWVSLIANVLIVGYFGWKVWTMSGEGAFAGPDGLALWAQTVLWLIPVSIVVTIVLSILFSIGTSIATGDSNPKFISDERDKRFSTRGMVVAMVVVSVGLIGGLVLLAFGGSAFVTLNLILFSFAFGAFLSEAFRLYFYRRGY